VSGQWRARMCCEQVYVLLSVADKSAAPRRIGEHDLHLQARGFDYRVVCHLVRFGHVSDVHAAGGTVDQHA
jgi:hypothetical protein